MGSILNGISYFGLHRCSGSTFLVFADYMRAPMRVAALSELPVNYILTHDSIGVGEVRHTTTVLLHRFVSRRVMFRKAYTRYLRRRAVGGGRGPLIVRVDGCKCFALVSVDGR